jgi:hypothetical protein
LLLDSCETRHFKNILRTNTFLNLLIAPRDTANIPSGSLHLKHTAVCWVFRLPMALWITLPILPSCPRKGIFAKGSLVHSCKMQHLDVCPHANFAEILNSSVRNSSSSLLLNTKNLLNTHDPLICIGIVPLVRWHWFTRVLCSSLQSPHLPIMTCFQFTLGWVGPGLLGASALSCNEDAEGWVQVKGRGGLYSKFEMWQLLITKILPNPKVLLFKVYFCK